MIVSTNCKFCQMPISIEIDDEYDSVADPYNLIYLVACNQCSDAREKRRKLEDKIKSICITFGRLTKPTQETRDIAKLKLTKLTQDYAKMIALWHHKEGMAWDGEGVELLLDKPMHWNQVLGVYWKLYRDAAKVE